MIWFRYYNCNDNHVYIGGVLVLSVPMHLYYITCIEEVFITGTYILLETIKWTVLCVAIVLVLGLVTVML